MGWTGGECLDLTALGLIEFELGAGCRERTLATHKKGGVVYAAVRAYNNRDEVFGLVLLVERQDGLTYTKAMDDTMGPAYYDCPSSILDLLTPTDSEYANQWREKCRKRAERRKPRRGDRVRLAEPVRFTDGKRRQVLIFEGRSTFRALDGTRVRITRWQDSDYTLA